MLAEDFKILETIIFYSHFCYDCFENSRDLYYYGTDKDKVKPCPRCGSLNVHGVFDDARH